MLFDATDVPSQMKGVLKRSQRIASDCINKASMEKESVDDEFLLNFRRLSFEIGSSFTRPKHGEGCGAHRC